MSQWEDLFRTNVQPKLDPVASAAADAIRAIQAELDRGAKLTPTQTVLIDTYKKQLATTRDASAGLNNELGP